MTLLLLAGALGLIVLPGCARPLGRRLPPGEWAKLCAGLLAAGALALEASLIVIGGPTVLRLAHLEAAAHLCEHALGELVPGGTPVGIAAAVIALLLGAAAVRSLVRTRGSCQALRIEPGIGWHGDLGGQELVVLPSQELVAFSMGRRPAQVVVSRRLIGLLTDEELAAVLRHELAHVHHRHRRYLLLARTVEQSIGLLLPIVRAGTAALRCALERWADEAAAAGGRRGRESVRAALLRVIEATAMPEVAAFVSPGTVLERLQALQTGPASGPALARRLGVYLPALLLAVLVLATSMGTVEHVAVLHILAGLCPH
jgi:hypothetical protein